MRPRVTHEADSPGRSGLDAEEPERFVTQGRLAEIGEQNMLFSSSRRAVFVLNDTAAAIWRWLESGMSPSAMVAEFASLGVDAQEGRLHVEAALESWEQLGLIRPVLRRPVSLNEGQLRQRIAVFGHTFETIYPAAVAHAADVFRHLEAEIEASGQVTYEMLEHRGRVHLYRDSEFLSSCCHEEVPTVLKGEILTEIMEHADYELALHGASLLRGDRILLLCGAPGAGKTTLSLALLGAGFGFAGDDVMLLDARGRGTGLPFAPAVKAGAWPLLSEVVPGLASAPIYRRPDRRRVRYPRPKDVVAQDPRSVGWLVLLSRGDGPAALEPIDPASAIQGVLDGAFALDGELTPVGFDALAHAIREAEIYRLTYSRLDEAVALLDEACR